MDSVLLFRGRPRAFLAVGISCQTQPWKNSCSSCLSATIITNRPGEIGCPTVARQCLHEFVRTHSRLDFESSHHCILGGCIQKLCDILLRPSQECIGAPSLPMPASTSPNNPHLGHRLHPTIPAGVSAVHAREDGDPRDVRCLRVHRMP